MAYNALFICICLILGFTLINRLGYLSFLSEILKLLKSFCNFETMENTLNVPEIRATYQNVCIQIINKDNASIVNENRSNLLRRIYITHDFYFLLLFLSHYLIFSNKTEQICLLQKKQRKKNLLLKNQERQIRLLRF